MKSTTTPDRDVGSSDSSAPAPKTGWWNPTPYSARRRVIFHYVRADQMTLCRKWLYIGQGTVEEGMDNHSDNCAACKKIKLKMSPPSLPNIAGEPRPLGAVGSDGSGSTASL